MLRKPKSATKKAKFSGSESDNTDSSGGSSEPIARTKSYRSKERKDGLELLIETMQLNSTASDNEVSILDGRTRDPKGWFRNFEKHASIMGWTEATMGKKIVRFLKKEAEGSWKDMKSKERNNYAMIKEKLIRELTPYDADYVAKRNFFDAAQREDESVGSFSRRIKGLAAKANVSEEDKQITNQFLRGIKSQIGMIMATHRPKNLESATNWQNR